MAHSLLNALDLIRSMMSSEQNWTTSRTAICH